MLASSKVSCLGCNHYFSAGRGLLSHLRQTTNQRCKTILQGFQANVQDEQAGPTEDPHQQTSDFSSETIMHLLIFQDGTTTAQTMVQHHREIYSRTRESILSVLFLHNILITTVHFRLDIPDPRQGDTEAMDVDVEEDEEDEADAEVEMSYGREAVEESLRQKIFIESFPGNTAGTPVPGAEVQGAMRPAEVVQGNPYSPFASQMDWQIARWAKLRGQGSTAMSELLGVPGVSDRHFWQFKSSYAAHSFRTHYISPTRTPASSTASLTSNSRPIVLAFSAQKPSWTALNSMSTIVTLLPVSAHFADKAFAPYLLFAPERHYTDETRQNRLYHDMYTGKWWWTTQVSIYFRAICCSLIDVIKEKLEARRPGATIIPVIIASDKTQVALFAGKSMYPVYSISRSQTFRKNCAARVRKGRKFSLHIYLLHD